MIGVNEFYDELIRNEVDFFCGVPDSLLKSFCAFVSDNFPSNRNIITANEGAAIALASGYYMGTGNIPVVYLQNSGIGNAVNPLISLTDQDVYSIPVLLLIGWRGEPGVKDEPQHVKQGKVTLELLEAMKIPYIVLNPDSNYINDIKHAIDYCRNNNAPFAFVIRKDTFSSYKLKNEDRSELSLSREQALEIILERLPYDSIVISSTGMLSRELFELREQRGEDHFRDFLTVGSMGHTSQIALGISLAKPKKNVFCFEGDGGVLMHLGSYAILAKQGVDNIKTIIFNNGAHDSVGGQPTIGFETDFQGIFKAFGYSSVFKARSENELQSTFTKFLKANGKACLEVQVRKGARNNLGRPSQHPVQSKLDLMNYLKE